MGLDLRWPIGLMFSLIGLLLTGYGLIQSSKPEVFARSLGINIDFYWGLLLVVFGGAMLFLAWRDSRKASDPQTSKPADKAPELTSRR